VKIDKTTLENGWDSGYYFNPSHVKWFDVTPNMQIKKGAQKQVDSRVKDTFKNECNSSLKSLEKIIAYTKSYVSAQNELNITPFVPSEKRDIVLEVFNSFINDLENHKLNAEHLLKKVESHAFSK
jgi:MoxR-like ATPase